MSPETCVPAMRTDGSSATSEAATTATNTTTTTTAADAKRALNSAESYGLRCREAAEELFACIARQDCQSFACSREQAAIALACGQGDPGTTGG